MIERLNPALASKNRLKKCETILSMVLAVLDNFS